MCNCEHFDHFDGGPGHEYMTVAAGNQKAAFVGAICDDCAKNCLPDWLV